MKNSTRPYLWVPTLYFAEGIPYFIVNTISVIMFKDMGMSNGDLALYTSLLYLPWGVKPLWSPFVDIIRTKRWWIAAMQALMAVAFAAMALSLPRPDAAAIAAGDVPVSSFVLTLIIFYLTALASATHDIAADGYYMIVLDPHTASAYVGIRSLFYRIASVFGQGVLVVVAGLLEKRLGSVPAAWTWTLALSATILGIVALYHSFILPGGEDTPAGKKDAKEIFAGFGRTFATFFRKEQVWLAIVFMLLYRLPEALSIKMLSPMMLDPMDRGGLGLSTEAVGLVYGTVGVIALIAGGILGGLAGAWWGLRKCLWPMSLSLALPCGVYVFLAAAQPSSTAVISACVAFDQFGYGFGFTAYMLYMMYFSRGEFATAHYSLCTAFMALSMMIPGLFAGFLQESLGYPGFFVIVMACCLVTVAVTLMIRRKIDPEYGKK